MHNDYCEDCGGSSGSPTADNKINLIAEEEAGESLFKRLLNTVESAYALLYKNGGYGSKDITQFTELIDATNKVFKEALNKGIEDNVIPRAMRTSLNQDVFVFSGLKTHAQLFEASRLLTDENGNLKSFQKFSQDVKKIKADYNENYLEAEYDFAVKSAQASAKWAKIEENEGRYNLQYRTAFDDRVRDTHEKLHNITLPTDHEFWGKYYPPNGWRCRCTAVEVRKNKYEISDEADAMEKGNAATTQLGKDGKNRMEIFRFNPGKSNVVFPPNHPYSKLQGAEYIKDLEYRDFVFNKPLEQQYSPVYNSKSGGKVLVHDLAEIKSPRVKSDDYLDRIETAKAMAKEGLIVKVMPEINIKEVTARKQHFKNLLSETSNPDFNIGSKYFDLKRPENIQKIQRNANKASKQGAIAVISDINLKNGISQEVAKRRASDILSKGNTENYKFNEVYFLIKGKLIKYKR